MKNRFRSLGKDDNGNERFACELETKVNTKGLADNEIEIIGSTSSTDRDGESIAPTAWNLKNYKKNPVILPQHNYYEPAIGRAKSVRVKDGKLMFKIEFPDEGINPTADVYRKLYKSGFMTASSVGFIPKKWDDGDGKKQPFRTFTDVELLELSLVSVPANPEAVTTGKSFNLTADEREIFEKSLGFKDVTGDEDEQTPESTEDAPQGDEAPEVDTTADTDEITVPDEAQEQETAPETDEGEYIVPEDDEKSLREWIGELETTVRDLQGSVETLTKSHYSATLFDKPTKESEAKSENKGKSSAALALRDAFPKQDRPLIDKSAIEGIFKDSK